MASVTWSEQDLIDFLKKYGTVDVMGLQYSFGGHHQAHTRALEKLVARGVLQKETNPSGKGFRYSLAGAPNRMATMSDLHDQVVKLAFDNPGEIRDKLLPILAKQAAGKPVTKETVQAALRSVGVRVVQDSKTHFLVKGKAFDDEDPSQHAAMDAFEKSLQTALHKAWPDYKPTWAIMWKAQPGLWKIDVPSSLKMRSDGSWPEWDSSGRRILSAGWTETDIGGKKYRFKKNKRFDSKNPVQSGFDMEYENPKYGWRDLKNLGSRDKVVKKHFKKASLPTRGPGTGVISPGMKFQNEYGVWIVDKKAPGTTDLWTIWLSSRGKNHRKNESGGALLKYYKQV